MNAMPVGVSSSIRSQQSSQNQTKVGRRLLVIRHGERIDFTFNVTHENWVIKAFDDDGRYKRFNINMPRSLPGRKDGHHNYMSDTPLTEMGYLQAKITGGLRRMCHSLRAPKCVVVNEQCVNCDKIFKEGL